MQVSSLNPSDPYTQPKMPQKETPKHNIYVILKQL